MPQSCTLSSSAAPSSRNTCSHHWDVLVTVLLLNCLLNDTVMHAVLVSGVHLSSYCHRRRLESASQPPAPCADWVKLLTSAERAAKPTKGCTVSLLGSPIWRRLSLEIVKPDVAGAIWGEVLCIIRDAVSHMCLHAAKADSPVISAILHSIQACLL